MNSRVTATRSQGTGEPQAGRRQAGQAIAVMLAAILAAVAVLALIIDGGNVVAHQRVSQAGADATSESGAILLAHRLAGATEPVGGWDANIAAKLNETATANNMTVGVAYYTDICGIPLQADGSAALDADGREDLSVALEVGNAGNLLPGGAATTPDCPNRQVGPVAGVLVVAETVIDAYVARAIGMPTFSISTRATAVTGYLQGFCDASEGIYCALLPVAFPVNVINCNGTNAPNPTDTGTPWTWNTVVKIPLCNNSPGNVGWLDWTPPYGGAGELVCSILAPNNPAVDLPSWQFVTQTGNQNGGGGACAMSVEDAIRTYNGKIVLVPQFDLTCSPAPSQPDPDSSLPAVVTPPNFGCPPGALGGQGTQLWYRMPSFAFFELCSPSTCSGLQGAYISGSNASTCNTGNGATACLVGKFRDILATGTVGAGVGSGTGSKALGVQLIR